MVYFQSPISSGFQFNFSFFMAFPMSDNPGFVKTGSFEVSKFKLNCFQGEIFVKNATPKPVTCVFKNVRNLYGSQRQVSSDIILTHDLHACTGLT
jgi:hypothetical protein